MRLLNTRTLTLTTFIGEVPEYVILSHRWEEEELVFEDLMKDPISNIGSSAQAKRGFSKVQGTCALAVKDGFDWVWIDSCCIDKSSSAELQKAINSMFRWYQEAQICYAYLSDVPDGEAGYDASFEQSLWFTRGWTLQELLAPCSVEFYAADWTPIGSKASRAEQIALITWIDRHALENDWADVRDNYWGAEIMSWAAHRLVTRAEDMAYCLLGLFEANMPLLYGEGEYKAFRRLQQAVFESEADYTLFLFATSERATNAPFIAYSTRQFCRRSLCRDCALKFGCLPDDITYSQMQPFFVSRWRAQDDHYLKLVKGGVKVNVPLIQYNSSLRIPTLTHFAPGIVQDRYVALLPLTAVGYHDYVFGLVLMQPETSEYVRCNGAPILVHTEVLGDLRPDPEAFIIYDELIDSSSSDWRYAQFEFRSSSFEVSSWRCTADDEQFVSTGGKARFSMPKVTSGHFSLTLKTSSASSSFSPIIVLGNSMENLRLQDVEVQGDSSTLRSASEQDYLTDRMTVPLGSAQNCINVALRRLSTAKIQHPPNGTIAAHYRVDMEYVGDILHTSESGTI